MNFLGMFRATALLCVLLLAACASDKSGIRVINASTTVYEVPSKTSGIAVKPIAQSNGRGSLILHGGGTFQHEIAADIIALAGPNPRLCLIDTADNGEGQIYRFFDEFRDVHLSVLNLQPSDTGRPDVVATLRDCTGFFFGGGAPQRLSETFRPRGHDTPALAAIRERFERHGAVVAGSSAGAMVVGPVTLCECGAKSSVLAVTRGELFKAAGFDLLSAPVLIDAHFFARGLLGRHMFALARDRIPVGVGIDEDTAVLVPGNGGPWVVLAGHKVALVKTPSDVTMDHLHGFGFSELFPGDRFDPLTGRVMVSSSRREMGPLEAILEDKAKDAPSIPLRYSFDHAPDTVPYVNASTGRIETYLNRIVSVDPL
jgi:cyanophycinase